ncbi:MAG: hypothetical protein NW206_04930 [Hyphomonadaceae bacterium]|nr:hypothetical protein [Hyphomonadaceae bacterium]
MWREGFSPELIAWALNALTLSFCAGLGARALIDPVWAARLMRMQGDESGEKSALLSSTLGGVFLASHAAALYFTMKWIIGGEGVIGIFAAGAAAALCGAWIGSALGRGVALYKDRALATSAYMRAAGVEALIGALIGAPWLVWALGGAR